MAEAGNYIIGYDLGGKYAQITYMSLEGVEEDVGDIPVCLCKRKGANQWFYGKEAQRYAASGKGELIDGLLSLSRESDTVTVDGVDMDPADLLTLFVRGTLSGLQLYGEGVRLRAAVLSVDELGPDMLRVLGQVKKGAFEACENVYFEAREESLFHYTVHQPRELRSYMVGVVDFSEEYLKLYRVEMSHHKRPVVTTVLREDYPDMALPGQFDSVLGQDRFLEELDGRLCAVMEKFLEGRIVTSIYLTGKVFEKEWCHKTLKLICRNRRVFKGSSLYSRGACFGAKEKLSPGEEEKDCIYLGREKLKANIGVICLKDGRESREVLIEGGVNWFEASAQFDFMPGEDERLPIVILPLEQRGERIVPLVLPAPKGRDPKSVRYCCRLFMRAENELVVQIEDVGFGMFCEPSGKQYEESILLGDGV